MPDSIRIGKVENSASKMHGAKSHERFELAFLKEFLKTNQYAASADFDIQPVGPGVKPPLLTPNELTLRA